ncbi:MAG: glycine cleavage system protein H [Nitrososphaerales archaeon]
MAKKSRIEEVVGQVVVSPDEIWAKVEGNPSALTVKVGITDKLQRELGNIEFVRVLPKGRYVGRGYPFGSIEAGRRVFLLRAPISGSIQEVNEELRADPTLLNKDPTGRGWVAALRPINLEEELEHLSK